jgi:signal transduction histidine kinase
MAEKGRLVKVILTFALVIVMEKIFSPFFTTKSKGTGLGLPIVKKIIEAHRGILEVLENPVKGVTFRVVIPLETVHS